MKKDGSKIQNIQKHKGSAYLLNRHLNNPSSQKYNKVHEKTKSKKKRENIDEEDSIICYLEERLRHEEQNRRNKRKKDELDYLLEDLDRINNFKTGPSHFKDKSTTSSDLDYQEDKQNINTGHYFIENKDNISLSKKNTDILKEKDKEDPYHAPIEDTEPITKNVIPKNDENDTESSLCLKKKIKRLLNKLTESNILSILNEIEDIYNSNSRYSVNLELTTLLLTHMISQEMLKDSYLILYSGFVSALYRIIGSDFGAFFLQRLVKTFSEYYLKEKLKKNTSDDVVPYNKECINSLIVLSELYNFQVISCTLIYDLIRLFLNEISDLNTELLLKIILNSGSQLRHDDPSSLKDIVTIMHQKISETNITLNSRTKFMIESINNLKNNKVKTVFYNNKIQEDILRMKKFLGTLSNRNFSRNTEPLKISLHDIEYMDKNNKWWHVGISSKKEEKSMAPLPLNDSYEEKKKDLLTLAQSQRMNTDIRRSIFVTIMSGEVDFADAFEKLLKLGLKKTQKFEIPRVLLHCCGNERNYNPYYTYIALRFCTKIHSMRTAFKFCLWDLFRSMGEKDIEIIGNINNDDSQDIPLRRIVNLGKLYASLVANDGLDLTIFKKLNFRYLQSKTKTFMEIFFSKLILETQKEYNSRNIAPIQKIFGKLSLYPPLAQDIKFFLIKYLKNNEIFDLKEDKEIFIWGFKKTLEVLDLLKDI
ncbi:hypothetical protein PORY_001078 [Pneumocystis oryctolagi]|uniref:Uncharacterized protein n=1 Tax=Pneumocystis oryctolagi TaxID=42067 RepID=A0ACB7CCQ1_9ASCO|nr:hypothetical protein PORY_001078 [Pneumocystis oryctolagi]